MGRTHVYPILQPDEITCGPAALKLALEILGKHKSLSSLMDLCRTNRHGTSTKNMIMAIRKLGYWTLVVERANLHHIQSALKYPPNQIRATMVSYLYDITEKSSGHWAVVSSFSASRNRIVLLDSYTGKKTTYTWPLFRQQWMDFDLERVRTSNGEKEFRLIRRWQRQMMIIVAKRHEELPRFRIKTAEVYPPLNHTVTPKA